MPGPTRRTRKLAVLPAPATIPGPKSTGNRRDSDDWSNQQMPRPGQGGGGGRERRERKESFQSFNKPKTKVTRVVAAGKMYIDYKDTESLKKMMSGNGKILN